MGGLLSIKRLILFLVVILLVGVGILPVLVMFIKSIIVNGSISLTYYRTLFSSSRELVLLENSLSLSMLTTMLAIAIGLPLGILFGKSDLPLRSVFIFLFTTPLLLPPYILAVSWFDLLGRDGYLASILGSGVARVTSYLLFGLPGCVLVLITTFMPIVMLLTITYLKTVNPHLEEAAKLVASWPIVLKSITIPIILPGVLLAAILVFILTLGEFSVPMFLRLDVLPVESFIQFSAFYNFGAGAAAAIPLVIITFLAFILERKFLREKTYQIRPVPGEEQALLIKLGSSKWWIFTSIGFFCLAIIILPLIVLVIKSASFSAYGEAIARGGDSIIRSIYYAIIGASGLTVIGFFLGYLVHAREFRFWRSIDSLTIFLFALPSAVIGIGLISLWNHPSTNLIYGTAAIIIIGYIAKYNALTSRITVSTLVQIPPSMLEAAQMVGAKWLRRITLILVPLAKRGLIAGWIVGYIFCLRDTGITMLVYPPGHDTLTVRIFTLMANNPADIIAALCMIMIMATLLPLYVLTLIFKPRKLAK